MADGTAGDQAGDEPPAVISLLAGKLDLTGFGATLAGLAARGWFEVRGPAAPGTPVPAAWGGDSEAAPAAGP